MFEMDSISMSKKIFLPGPHCIPLQVDEPGSDEKGGFFLGNRVFGGMSQDVKDDLKRILVEEHPHANKHTIKASMGCIAAFCSAICALLHRLLVQENFFTGTHVHSRQDVMNHFKCRRYCASQI